MHPVQPTMSSSPYEGQDAADGRIPREDLRQHPLYTASGEAVLVQPSFDESIDRSKTPVGLSPVKVSSDWQARSPNEDGKQGDGEPRNPSSPPNRNDGHMSARHERQLSAHFFDATSLSPRAPALSDDPTVESNADDKYSGRKHRRMFSGDVSNPVQAHRRINSIGNSAMIQRGSAPHSQHHRVDSAGLDMLSAAAAVDISKEELSAAAGPPSLHQPQLSSSMPQGQPRPVSSYPVSEGHHRNMLPPDHRRHMSQSSYSVPYGQSSRAPYAAPPSHYPPVHPSPASSYYPPPGAYPGRPSMHHAPPPPPHGYPAQYAQRPLPVYTKGSDPYDRPGHRRGDKATPEWSNASGANHQGSQTFVTAIAVGDGNRTINPANFRKDDVPAADGHHRKMSSLSSFGNIFGSGSGFLSPDANSHPLKTHHRATSSTISFLPGYDVGLDSNDDTFLRNLQAANSASAVDRNAPTPPPTTSAQIRPAEAKQPPRPQEQPSSSVTAPEQPQSKLAAGGTSKRVRRKCTVEGCPNRVVQGGLCIAHGAKRKTCKHPGCTKNVKKAGLCSTHGPARKRCEAEGCNKVAVQGGRCISHGAKKRMCSVSECTKQAILGGMCKKHHDKAKSEATICKEVSPKPSHQRGLSIFQEMTADAVGSILDAPGANSDDSNEMSGQNSEGNPW